MSTLKVNTIQNTSGGSSSTPEQIEQGRCKMWITIDGTGTVGILDSFNVSSISDEGTGLYEINYSSALGNANYCTVTDTQLDETSGSTSTDNLLSSIVNTPQTTSKTRVFSRQSTSSTLDVQRMFVAVFGD
jgi:hypothetical protein